MQNLFAIFIDFSRAFDSIHHTKLLLKLFDYQISTKILKLIQNLHKNATLQIKLDHNVYKVYKVFNIMLGVSEGGVLSPLLFMLFVNDIWDFLKTEVPEV